MKLSELQLQRLHREALVLTAVDPALQGVYLWGFPDDFVQRAQRLLLRWSARPGPVVRIPVTATPRELHRMLDTEQTFVQGSPYYRPGLVARAESGIILISSTDLLRADTAAALNWALSNWPSETRPLLIASSDGPPNPDCPIASVCALWVDGSAQPYSTRGRSRDRTEVSDVFNGRMMLHERPGPATIRRASESPGRSHRDHRSNERWRTLRMLDAGLARHDQEQDPRWNEPDVSAAKALLDTIDLSTEIIEAIARRTATMGCPAPTVDFFVARAARARAAVYGRDHVTDEDLDVAFQLAAAPRAAIRHRGHAAFHHQRHGQQVVEHDVSPWGSGTPAMDDGDDGDHTTAEPATSASAASRSAANKSATGRPDTGESVTIGDATGMSETTTMTGASSPRQDYTDALSRRPDTAPSEHGSSPPFAHRNRTDPDGDKDNSPMADPTVIVVPPEDLFQVLTLPEGSGRTSPTFRPGIRRDGPRPTGPIQGVTAQRNGTSVAVAPTIAAALPWQRIRPPRPSTAVRIMPEDLRRYRRQFRPVVLYVLVVDGSGSMAPSRMQLAKGAALAVLQGAYKQRRYVSLVEFRGRRATVLRPPGRSATAVRRLVTELGSGGGTPLPAALDASRRLAAKWRSRHADGSVRVIVFTDGKANVPLNPGVADPDQPVRRDETVAMPEWRATGGADDPASPSPRTPHGSESTSDESLTATRERRRRVWMDVETTAAALLVDGVKCHIVDAGAAPAGPELKWLGSLLQAPILKVTSTSRVRRRRG